MGSLYNLALVVDWQYLASSVTAAWPVWLLGVFVGMLLPRQTVFTDGFTLALSSLGAVGTSAVSSMLSQAMMCVHGAMFIQSLWYKWTSPGTFHALCSRVFPSIDWPVGRKGDAAVGEDAAPAEIDQEANFFITEDDLRFFVDRCEKDSTPDADKWDSAETIVNKSVPDELTYVAKRRMLRDIKKTEYKSISVTADTTPQEVRPRVASGWVGSIRERPAASCYVILASAEFAATSAWRLAAAFDHSKYSFLRNVWCK
jgi:hypothetical protein